MEHEIEEIYRELAAIKDEEGRLTAEARKLAEKRALAYKKIRELGLEIINLKIERDSLNRRVKDLKALREEKKKKCGETIVQIRDLKQKVKEAELIKPFRGMRDLESEIERIDWIIQTNPLPLEDEKRLVNQVRLLENQLAVHKGIKSLKDQVKNLNKEVETLKFEIQSCHEEMLKVAEQSQTIHQQILKASERIRALKAEAEDLKRKYVEARERIQVIRSKSIENLNQIKSYKRELQEIEERERAERLSKLQRELREKALEKLRQGKKLTFDEFKILSEHGEI